MNIIILCIPRFLFEIRRVYLVPINGYSSWESNKESKAWIRAQKAKKKSLVLLYLALSSTNPKSVYYCYPHGLTFNRFAMTLMKSMIVLRLGNYRNLSVKYDVLLGFGAMETVCFSEILASSYESIRHRNPEEHCHRHRRVNIKSRKTFVIFLFWLPRTKWANYGV
jgi:hypothetical protein